MKRISIRLRQPHPFCRLFSATAGFCLSLSVLVPPRVLAQIPQTEGAESNQSALQQETSLPDLLKQADELADKGRHDEARKLYESALVRAREEKSAPNEARALAGIGRGLSAQSKYAQARPYLEQALVLAEKQNDQASIGRFANSLGIVAQYLGEHATASQCYRRAITAYGVAGNQRGKANSLLNLAMVSSDTQEQAAARTEAIAIGQNLKDESLEARGLHSLGDWLFQQGDFGGALEKLEESAELYKKIGELDALATVYTSQGRLYRVHGRPTEAIPFYDKALAIQRQIGDRTGEIQSLNAIGVAYSALSQFEKAGEYYEQAYSLAQTTGSPRIIDFMRGGLAGNLMALEKFDRAAPLIEEILRRGADSNSEFRRNQLSHAYAGMGRLTEALAQADLAIETARGNKNTNQLVHGLLQRASMLGRLDKHEDALKSAQEAILILEQMRSRLVPTDFMRQGFSEYYQWMYSLTIELHTHLGQTEKALEVAELARARSFLDLLATREVQLKEKDRAALAELRKVEKELQKLGAEPPPAGQAESAPQGATSETAALLARWQKANPELLSFVSAQPLTVGELRAIAVRLHSTILSYWAAPETLFVWLVKPSGEIRSQRVEVKLSRLARLVEAATQFPIEAHGGGSSSSAKASQGGSGQMALDPKQREVWRELYRILVRPVRKELPSTPGSRLTIVPHGPLMRLPFAALLDEKGRYLLESFTLHYVPAAALLKFSARKKQTSVQAGTYLLVADPSPTPALKGEKPLAALPGARREALAIARLLPAKNVLLLAGEQADESSVISAMNGRSVVHLATHGVVRDDDPFGTYLALGAKRGTQGDGRLTAQEVYSLDLRADLVILSACRSGSGRLTGDGIAALARAFFYAGTPSLIVTQWDVADQPTSRLVSDFYRTWLRGKDKSEALRAAQLQLLRDLRLGRVSFDTPAGRLTLPEHPIFWAGFVLLGEP